MKLPDAIKLIHDALNAGSVLVVDDFDVTAGVLSADAETSPPIAFVVVDSHPGGDVSKSERTILALALEDAEALAKTLAIAVRETHVRLRAMKN